MMAERRSANIKKAEEKKRQKMEKEEKVRRALELKKQKKEQQLEMKRLKEEERRKGMQFFFPLSVKILLLDNYIQIEQYLAILDEKFDRHLY